jgi:C-terminal processing protease CtpA/Prc
VELRGFGPTGLVAPAYDQAMALLAGSQALIVDLRRNGGGEPSSVAYFMSHFFPIGDERHLNDIYTRSSNQTQQYWTGPVGSERYDKPVYVLTSARTFSGGEECAYDFQTQHRGVLVGDTTGGGSNPVDVFGLGHGLVVAIPVARAINPITHSNWEHVGVKPDISVPAAQAQQAAYTAILSQLAAQAHEPDEREYLQHLLSLAKQGQSEPPRYTAGP